MRFAYADPPYLGQGASRYGHLHSDAAIWDDPATHLGLIERLEDEYPDGWAISTSTMPDALMCYVGNGRELAIWVRPGWQGSIPQARIMHNIEAVFFRTSVPNTKAAGPIVTKSLVCDPKQGHHVTQNGKATHTGTKPPPFCRWVLDLLGFDPNRDVLDDLFPGEGAMSRAVAQHRLDLWSPEKRASRPWLHRPGGTTELAL